jgi:hypothetical protein
MNKLERLVISLYNRWLSWLISPDPKPSTIDMTGIVWSDYPTINNGWIKGWLVDTDHRNIIIVCKHAGPSTSTPNNKVFFTDKFGKKIERSIISVDNLPYKLDGKSINVKDSRFGIDNYFLSGDISICKLDYPIPLNIKAYKFSTNPKILNKQAITVDQNKKLSNARVYFNDSIAWVFGKNRNKKNLLIAGDSGTPWFVWDNGEWRVLTHTTKGMWGEGPYYGHPLIYKDILNRINNM